MTRIRLDFSVFHPLDHWPGTAYCRSLPGGVRNHLHIAWVFQRRDQVLQPFRRVLSCPFGRHTWDVWSSVHRVTRVVTVIPACRYCTAERLPSESEIDAARTSPLTDPDTTFEVTDPHNDGE